VRGDVTQLLDAYGRGEPGAFDQLVTLVYQDLRRIARGQRRRVGANDSMQTTALVNEAYLKLSDHDREAWSGRGHFLAVAAVAMRQILVDHARHRLRKKRGGGAIQTSLDAAMLAVEADAERMLAVDQAPTALAAEEPRLVRVVECRYFAGLSEQETADALGVSLRTAQRDWLKARARLRASLG
jgi:RNA polymerase sigma factor (TIGR02999 family)